MIPSQTIEEIRNKSDIVAVVSGYVRLRKTGKNYVGLCPFHSEKTGSFTVSPDKQLFHCFGCGEGGNVFSFIMKIESLSFIEAAEELGGKIGIAVEKPSAASVASKLSKEKSYDAVLLAAKFYRKCYAEDAGKAAREYVEQRGISEETAKIFGLGFAPEGWDNLFKHLIARGVDPKVIEQAGLTLPREEKDGFYDRFRNRLMFPVFDARGRVVAFSGRAVKNEEPKYLNSPDTPVYHKGETVFGLSLTKDAIKEEKLAVLVEGNVDVVSVYQAGIKNVAAPLGTALTPLQCKLLARFADTIVLAFDADAAGEAATERSIEILRDQGLKVKIAEIKGAKDPDELIRKEGASAFSAAIDSALPALEFKIKRTLSRHNLSEIEARSRALSEIAGLLSREKDAFVQNEYAKLAALPLKVEAETILAAVKRQSYYQRGGEKNLRRMTEKPVSKVLEAENMLIALAVQNKEFLEQLKKALRAEDFTYPETKLIAEVLFAVEAQSNENLPHFLLENLPEESAKKLLAKILLNAAPAEAEQVLDDCIKTLKAEKTRGKIEALKVELKAAESAGRAMRAAELLTALKTEIS